MRSATSPNSGLLVQPLSIEVLAQNERGTTHRNNNGCTFAAQPKNTMTTYNELRHGPAREAADMLSHMEASLVTLESHITPATINAMERIAALEKAISWAHERITQLQQK